MANLEFFALEGLKKETDEQLFSRIQEVAKTQESGGKAPDELCKLAMRACDLLMERHYEGLSKHVASQMDNLDAADDVVITTWEAAWEKAHQFRGDKPFKNWLYRIARNKMRDMMTRTSQVTWGVNESKLSEVQQLELNHKCSPNPSPEALVCNASDFQEKKAEVALRLSKLPQLLKTIYVLREGHGMGYRKIGEFLWEHGLTDKLLNTTQVHHRYTKACENLSKATSK